MTSHRGSGFRNKAVRSLLASACVPGTQFLSRVSIGTMALNLELLRALLAEQEQAIFTVERCQRQISRLVTDQLQRNSVEQSTTHVSGEHSAGQPKKRIKAHSQRMQVTKTSSRLYGYMRCGAVINRHTAPSCSSQTRTHREELKSYRSLDSKLSTSAQPAILMAAANA